MRKRTESKPKNQSRRCEAKAFHSFGKAFTPREPNQKKCVFASALRLLSLQHSGGASARHSRSRRSENTRLKQKKSSPCFGRADAKAFLWSRVFARCFGFADARPKRKKPKHRRASASSLLRLQFFG
uniref:Uncharacterized protein n=1 Tax=Pediastrum duplex TaxID=3105 RepID=A0A2U8GIS1_PEDDU|nr:hypothetical protein [Pediastrum duplex]